MFIIDKYSIYRIRYQQKIGNKCLSNKHSRVAYTLKMLNFMTWFCLKLEINFGYFKFGLYAWQQFHLNNNIREKFWKFLKLLPYQIYIIACQLVVNFSRSEKIYSEYENCYNRRSIKCLSCNKIKVAISGSLCRFCGCQTT